MSLSGLLDKAVLLTGRCRPPPRFLPSLFSRTGFGIPTSILFVDFFHLRNFEVMLTLALSATEDLGNCLVGLSELAAYV